jgi:hypothetical protein
VTVRTSDRREFRAKVLGTDKATDVAVLKIDASNLPSVRLGDASKARVGEWVVAIGAPYGLEHTVTSGIISAKSRSLPGDSVVGFIQTDAAVNPGNSGGPLFNLDGEVIGINSQIFSRSGGFQGLAFAIPINTALNVKDQIVAHGKVSHGKLGITVQEVNQALAESFEGAEPGIAEERRKYLHETSVSKNPQLSAELQGMYEGKCQLCLWDPRAVYADSICEAHHIVWLSRGGEDALGNLVLLCPNLHRVVHRTDAPLDFGDMAFDFGTQREGLRVNRHLGTVVYGELALAAQPKTPQQQ